MKYFFRSNRPIQEDLFRSIRELRSPLSLERLQLVVSETADRHISIWNYFWSLLTEILALGIVAAVVWNSSLAGSTRHAAGAPDRSVAIKSVSQNDRTSAHSFSSLPIFSERRSSALNQQKGCDPSFEKVISNPHPPKEVLSEESRVDLIPSIKERIVTKGILSVREPASHSVIPIRPSLSSADHPEPEWTLEGSGGATFSSIRMASEGLAVHWNNDWESIGITVMNAGGSRDKHEILMRQSMTTSMIDNESDQFFAVMGGGNFYVGPIQFRAEAGPAFCISTTNSIVPSTMVTTPFATTRTIGAEGSISAFYPVTSFLQAGITGISVIQKSQWTNSIMVSFSLTP